MTWQKATGDKSCVSCGKCCANILMLSDKEIKIIKKYINEHEINVINRNSVFLKEDANICPFLVRKDKETYSCAIYDVRPSICRSFSCNPNYKVDMDYKGVKAINMLFTFGGKNQFSIKAPDLTEINKRVKELQDKIYQKRKR